MVKRPFFKIYLNATMWLTIILLPFGILGTFLGVREVITQTTLLISLLLDISLIAVFLYNTKFTRFEIILILLILSSIPIGILNGNAIDRRLISDFTNPLFFVVKCAIFRKLFKDQRNFPFWNNFIRKFIKASLVLGIVSIVTYYILARFQSMYAGITPITHPYFINSLQSNSAFGQLFSLIIVILSGKRALLFSSIVIFLVYRIYLRSEIRKVLVFIGVFIGIVFVGVLINTVSPIAAVEKYKWTFETIAEADVEINLDDESGILDVITGGRLAEVQGALKVMQPVDYLIGRGAGFTYTYYSAVYEKDFIGYSNLHFSPLSIITKYGSLFLITFSLYFLYNLFGFKNWGFLGIFFGLYLCGFLIDMLFAYVVFVDPFLPIALGYLSSKKSISVKGLRTVN